MARNLARRCAWRSADSVLGRNTTRSIPASVWRPSTATASGGMRDAISSAARGSACVTSSQVQAATMPTASAASAGRFSQRCSRRS